MTTFAKTTSMGRIEDTKKMIVEKRKARYLSQCRYYKGEQTNPYDNPKYEGTDKALIWFYESRWFNMIMENANHPLLIEYAVDYNAAGLSDFSKSDNVPQTLKALLLNRYLQWLGYNGSLDEINSFKKWYRESYIGQD